MVSDKIWQCENCGKRVERGRKHCNMLCRRIHLNAPQQCKNCRVVFTAVQYPDGQCLPDNTKRATCSRKCQQEWLTNDLERRRKLGVAFRGDKHPNWQGGKTWISNRSYRGSDWPSQSAQARKRDQYECRRCGMSEQDNGRELDVHHIIPYFNFPSSQAANRLQNLLSTCQSCHKILEAQVNQTQLVLPLGQNSHGLFYVGKPKGERINTAKLTAQEVLFIRKRAAEGEDFRGLADEFGLQPGSLYSLVKGKTWKHIPLVNDGKIPVKPHLYVRGERMYNARFSDSEVLSIRQRVAQGEHVPDIAREYGVVNTILWSIIRGRTWKHLPLSPVPDIPRKRGPRGEESYFAKLTVGDVIKIRELGATGMKNKEIAVQFSVTPEAINLILKRKNWTHI